MIYGETCIISKFDSESGTISRCPSSTSGTWSGKRASYFCLRHRPAKFVVSEQLSMLQLVSRSGLSISQSGLVVYADGENLGKCADVECAVRVVNRVVRVDEK